VEAIVYNHPEAHIRKDGSQFFISFETSAGWRYEVQAQTGGSGWEIMGESIDGTGAPIEVQIASGKAQHALFRISGSRL
jgi:hypothetical protein